MAKLKSIQSKIQSMPKSNIKKLVVSSYRMAGTKLQKRRFKLWQASPHCAMCQRFVIYPDGFELDHVIPLYKGGEDIESNCQLLCHECHHNKTLLDAKG